MFIEICRSLGNWHAGCCCGCLWLIGEQMGKVEELNTNKINYEGKRKGKDKMEIAEVYMVSNSFSSLYLIAPTDQ